ncbi:beta-galactosidase [Aestuariibaculum lutulentum]|uniref:Beta-galactosidase n=2 Tax=Aestuariibaculum lutulentum TaxID=2920935 RepID=A0ABS9RIC7_9FLAO|nr:beta-galactosidase [Aestuariibaculum lutulentum]MCH4552690.1 beta-galactosidase [Aestuariibaculum lutulentum]
MRNSIFLVFVFICSIGLNAQTKHVFFQKEDLMSIGIYYYPEHWNKSEWERDIKNISELGFEFIHLAEFAWINLEPQEGVYTFGWLDEVIALAEKYHLKVILGTPTAIAPVWMGIKYPEIYAMGANYLRAEHGTRAQQSLSNPIWRAFSEKIITKLGERYGHNLTVIGWQLDNEPEAKEDYSPSSQDAFRKWLEKKYQSIEALNKAWGTQFWSQTYSDFNQVQIHNASHVGWWGTNPHALLDFKRFSADTQADFLDFQADILRPLISTNQYITTNYTATTYGADPRRTKKLDFNAFTSYPNKGQANIGDLGFRLGDPKELSFALSFFKQQNTISGVMELQPGFVNWGQINPLLQPGALRMWLYHCFGGDLSFACSYRYRQINYGAEQYHSGITTLDGVSLSQGGKEYKQVIQEMKLLKKAYNPSAKMPEALKKRKTAMLWSFDNRWSLDRQAQTSQWHTLGFFQKYLEIVKSFGAPADILYENDDLSDYTLVIAPAFELVDDEIIEKWTNYVKQGGNLVLTTRTGVKDKNGHLFQSGYGAKMYPLIDAEIEYFDHLLPNMKGTINANGETYFWNNWADLIAANHSGNVLATYTNQFYAGKAAVVSNSIGKGTVTYIGVDTDDAKLEKDILQSVYQKAGASIENYPEGIYVQWRDGFWVAVNYSSEDYKLTIPANSEIIMGTTILKPGGVTVWKEK